MSDDSDFPYLAEDRRNFRKQVAVSTVAVLIGIGILVMKCTKWRAEENARRAHMVVSEGLRDYPLPPIPTAATPAADEPTVELELVRGSWRHDVDGSAIALDDGRTLLVTARPQWTYSGADLSFTYDSSLRVNKGPDGTILLGGGDTLAELAILETDATEAEGVAELARTYESTGQVAASEETGLTLLGRKVAARRIVTSGPVAEVAAAAAGKGRQLRVIITATSSSADPSVVRRAVETVTLAKRSPTPEMDVTLRSATGESLATVEATIGTPFEIAGEKMTIARRATVRRQLGGMRFEHSPELTVTTISGAAPAVSLRSGTIGIQVMVAPFTISSAELSQAIGVSVADATPITRSFGNTTYRGVAGEFQMGEIAMHTQAFTFERGGRPFIVMIQSPKTDADHAAQLADSVVASVQ